MSPTDSSSMKAKGILLTILLTCGASVLGGECPDTSVFEPCRCNLTDVISVSCFDISSTAQLEKVIDNSLDYSFDEFRIESSNFAYFNTTWLAQKRTRTLELEKMTMSDLFPLTNSTATLPSMEILRIGPAFVQRGLQWAQFRPFVRLEQLVVTSTEVKKLGKSFRENVSPELQYLSLNDTKFSGLEEGDLDGKPKLSIISITNGGLKIVKNSFFKDQKLFLMRLELSSNPIESLPDDLFQGFQSLRYIDVKKSKITTLSETLFQRAPRFFMLFDVSDNPLICDCKMKWITAKRSFAMIGTCDTPTYLKSKNLMNLTEKDFPLCGRRNTLPFDH